MIRPRLEASIIEALRSARHPVTFLRLRSMRVAHIHGSDSRFLDILNKLEQEGKICCRVLGIRDGIVQRYYYLPLE